MREEQHGTGHAALAVNHALGPGWLDHVDSQELWERLNDIPDAEIWQLRQALRNDLFSFIRERMRARFSEEHVGQSFEAVGEVAGRAILLVSLELEEVRSLADRVLAAATEGHGADVVIDAVGRPETWKQAFYARDLAGTVVLDIPIATAQQKLHEAEERGAGLWGACPKATLY